MAVRGQTPAGLNPAVVVAAKIIVAETGVKVGVIVVVVGKELPVILAEGIVSDAAVLRLAEIRLRFIFDNIDDLTPTPTTCTTPRAPGTCSASSTRTTRCGTADRKSVV